MIKHRTQLTFSGIFLILMLCLSLTNVSPALADEGTATAPPSAPTDVPTELPPATDVPTELAPATEVATDTPMTEEVPLDQLLATVPDDTGLVVVNETGDTVSLASQEAADIVQGADPTWCPDGAVPGSASCRRFTSLPTSNQNLTALITDMRTNPGLYSSGTIYLEDPSGVGFTTPLILDDSAGSLSTSFDSLRTINLNVVGGWVPATNGFNGDTDFGLSGVNQGFISIGSASNPWVGNIGIQDVTVTGNTTSNPSVSVFTTSGSVTFNDVDVNNAQNASAILVSTISGNVSLTESDIVNGVNNNGITVTTVSGNISFNNDDVQNQETGNTASLTTQTGNIDVSNGSLFDGNNGNLGFAATSNSGSITITGTPGNPTFRDARGAGDGTNNNGATLSAPIITLTDVTATNNDGHGIAISNANVVTLNNVTSTGNGSDIGSSGNADNNNVGSGVYVNGNPGSTVIVNGGVFRRNQRYGIEVINGTIYILANPSCGTGVNVNDSGCYNTSTVSDNTPPTISFVSQTPANGSGWNNTDVVLTWSCADAQSGVFNSTVSRTVSSEGTNQSATGTCTNHVGLTATNTQSGINIDKTGPIASASAAPAPNSNGWNNTDVTVSFSGSDALSGLAFCDPDMILSTEGAGQSASGTCTDKAGNVSTPAIASNINIDKTGPALNLPANISVGTTSMGATINYTVSATDNFDESATVDCLPASGSVFPLGTTVVNCSSTDQAGNTTSGSFNVTVSDATVIVPPVIPGGTTTGTETDQSPDLFVPVTGGNTIDIVCNPPAAFETQSGDLHLTFNNLCGYQAFLENLSVGALPGALPGGASLLDGFILNVMKDGKSVDPLPKDASILIQFKLPADQKSAKFALLQWDGNEWVEVKGEETADGYFSITTAESGTYIIVRK